MMQNTAKFGMRQWYNFDQSFMRDFLWNQESFLKLEQVQRELNAVIAERNAALEEKKHAYAERDSALLQRDIAYADRHAAIVQRDNALAEFAMIAGDQSNQGDAPKLLQTVSVSVNHVADGSNSLLVPTPINDIQMNHIEDKLPYGEAMQFSKEAETEISREMKDSSTSCRPKKRPKAAGKRQFQDQEASSSVEKIKRQVNAESMILYESQIDMSSITQPFCSCTGAKRKCYRWGNGGWQSSCCTNLLSEFPLPMRNTKRGSRVAGRKMTGGAFKKLLEKLTEGGIDITQPIDLKGHWAKHGTNRYIVVR